MLRGAALVLLVLAACGPPPGDTCQRVLVSATGQGAAGGFGGAGGSGGAAANALGIAGEPLTLTLFAPLSSCVSDALRASVEVLGPDNLPVPVALSGPPRVLDVGVVQVALAFTPAQAGSYLVRTTFEPSLGVRTTVVDVAASRLDAGFVTVPLPGVDGCLGGAWPLTADTVACERASGAIELRRADGGVTSFDGEQLVVVDTVLWSVHRGRQSLERRVFEDGGLRLADAFAGIDAVVVPALHDTDLAVRQATGGQLTILRVGAATLTPAFFPGFFDGRVLFADPPGQFYLGGNCFDASCVFDLQGLEAGVVWRTDPSTGQLRGLARPLGTLDDAARFTLRQAPESPALPTAAFERVPLWLPARPPVSVLASLDDGVVTLSAWNKAEVVRVGRRFVLLRDSTGVRVVQR